MTRVRDQAFGKKYFLILSPSVLNSTRVPRSGRICFFVRLIMPWRLPAWAAITLPVAVTLKRFLAPDLVFSLGIWLSYRPQKNAPRGALLRLKMLVRALKVLRFSRKRNNPHGSSTRQPLISRAMKAGLMAEEAGNGNDEPSNGGRRRMAGCRGAHLEQSPGTGPK